MSTIEPPAAPEAPDTSDASLSAPLELERHEQAARAHFMLAEVFEELGNLESSRRERTLGEAYLAKSSDDR